MLTASCCRPSRRCLAADWFRLGHELPRSVPLRVRSRWNRVVDPDEFRGLTEFQFGRVFRFDVLETGQRTLDVLLSRVDLLLKIADSLLLIVCKHLQRRRVVLLVSVHRVAVDGIEKGEHRIKIFLRERVVLVVVAARAVKGHPHEDCPRRHDSVDDVSYVNLILDRAALAGRHMAAVEACRDELIIGRVGDEVTGELLDDELVVRLARVKRVDDPVAVSPHFAVVVQVQPVRISVPCGVEPEAGHVLTEGRRREQAVHKFFIGLRRVVLQERVDFSERRWKAGEVERHSPDECLASRLPGWREL